MEGDSSEGPRRSGTGRALRVPSEDLNRTADIEPANLNERFSNREEPGTPRRRNTRREIPGETVSETVAQGEEVPDETISETVVRMYVPGYGSYSRLWKASYFFPCLR